MHRVTDRVKRFYAKTKKLARLNASLQTVSELRTVRFVSAPEIPRNGFRRFFTLRVLRALCELCVQHFSAGPKNTRTICGYFQDTTLATVNSKSEIQWGKYRTGKSFYRLRKTQN
jgi:hypothetical protein